MFAKLLKYIRNIFGIGLVALIPVMLLCKTIYWEFDSRKYYHSTPVIYENLFKEYDFTERVDYFDYDALKELYPELFGAFHLHFSFELIGKQKGERCEYYTFSDQNYPYGGDSHDVKIYFKCFAESDVFNRIEGQGNLQKRRVGLIDSVFFGGHRFYIQSYYVDNYSYGVLSLSWQKDHDFRINSLLVENPFYPRRM